MVFRAFVHQQLRRHLKPGDIVIIDNLSSHRDQGALEVIRQAGVDVLFLPPYSPELNPIEKAWAKLKTFLRRAETLTREAFDTALAAAMAKITTADIHGWARHSGYSVHPENA